MNIVKELRKRAGVQQKELAIALGVSQPTVSEWEQNKKDPSGERLKKLAKYFNVDELVILGKIVINLNKEENFMPQTPEAKILARGIDRMPEEDRKRAIDMMNLMFKEYAKYFERTEANDDEA